MHLAQFSCFLLTSRLIEQVFRRAMSQQNRPEVTGYAVLTSADIRSLVGATKKNADLIRDSSQLTQDLNDAASLPL